MSLVAAKCTQCGAELQVDNSKEAAICEHCGTPFIVEKAINNYNTYVTQNFAGANVTVVGATADAYIERAYMFLEDKKWNEAVEYAEKALDILPKSAKAYVAIFMARHEIPLVEDISKEKRTPIADDSFAKAIKYDDGVYAQNILDNWSEVIYKKAFNLENSAKSEVGYSDAIAFYNTIRGYKDTDERIELCEEKKRMVLAEKEKNRISSIIERAKREKSSKDIKSLELLHFDLSSIKHDEAETLIKEVEANIKLIKRNRLFKEIAYVCVAVALLAIAMVFVRKQNIENSYIEAVETYEKGKYSDAYDMFLELGDYKDSKELLEACGLEKTKEETTALIEKWQKDFDKAIISNDFVAAGDAYRSLLTQQYISGEEKDALVADLRGDLQSRAFVLYKDEKWQACYDCCSILHFDSSYSMGSKLSSIYDECRYKK